MRHLISDLLRCDGLHTAGKVLGDIDAYLNDNPTKRASFCRALAKDISEVVAVSFGAYTSPARTYTLYRSSFSIPPYLMSNGLATGGVRQTRESVKRLIADIGANAVPPSGKCLPYDRAAEILNAVGELFPYYYSIVSRARPLAVLNLNSTDRRYNSMCGISDLSSGSTILLLHMKADRDEGDPDCVLLHEMGHALHNAISGADVPEEFYRFQSAFSKPLERGDPMAPEVFADCFAIAMIHRSDLKIAMPFEVDAIIADMVARFMEQLMQSYTKKV